MFTWSTRIRALCPKSGEILTYMGPFVKGYSRMDAQEYCENNGLGYCKVVDRVISVIPADEHNNPLWDQEENYDITLNLN